MASSLAEQIIPSDMWPYVLRAPISNPPGSIAPGRASATRSPTAKPPGRLVGRSVELRLGDSPPAVPDRLLQPGQLLDREHLGDHHAADVIPDRLQRFDLEARGGQSPGYVRHVDRLGQRRVLAQPGKRYSHVRSPSRTPG